MGAGCCRWSAFCRAISGCKRPSSTATIRPLSSSSLTPPSSNKLPFVLRYLLSARSFFPNTPTHPETGLRLHRTRRQEKRFEGGGEPAAAAHRSGLPSRSAPHRLPSPVFTSPPKPTQQRNPGRCGQIARRCGSPSPCPRAASAPLTPRSAGGSAPQQVTRLGSVRGAGALPERGVWLARRGPAPAHLRS